MSREINVNAKDYPRDIKVKCEKCHDQLLLFVHRNYQEQTCILGCGFCGHKNEIKLGEGD